MSTGLLVGQASFREIPDSTTVESTPMEEVQAAEIDKELATIADPNNRMVFELLYKYLIKRVYCCNSFCLL